MTTAFYFDHNVPAAIRRGLRLRKVDVLTAWEDGTSEWDDESLLNRVDELNRVVFTSDEDFLEIAHRRHADGSEFPGIVFAEQLFVTIGQVLDDLEILAKCGDPDEMRNKVEYLPLSC